MGFDQISIAICQAQSMASSYKRNNRLAISNIQRILFDSKLVYPYAILYEKRYS